MTVNFINTIVKRKSNVRISKLSNEQMEIQHIENIENDNKITTYFVILALSVHACFEGIALGLQKNVSKILYMFLAISFHKWVESLSIGINLSKSNIDKNYFLKFIILFSLMTPLGIIIGILFSGFSEIIEAIFLSISAGKF